ncbi:uncharacterized protein LOC106052364 isoform X2 [Biomphalaria glabrata]|uniref:Uncharacterized protein LOC106052364 isoform X2 n=1 Tax=Biomphalaria glabrata TaxID=6526 RepID=A0A9W2YRX6_BIOGL|nr:uncharacterized protein LOC106052364 isoform X2 [Biomphalaria glabrata]
MKNALETHITGFKTCKDMMEDSNGLQNNETFEEVTFCFTDILVNNVKVMIFHNNTELHTKSDKVTFNWKENNSYHFLHIHIYNITDSDLTEWKLILRNKEIETQLYEKSFRLYTDSQVQFHSTKRTDQNELTEEIICKSSNFPKKIEIINRCEDIKLETITYNSKNYKRTLALKLVRNSIYPSETHLDLATYECRVLDFQNKVTSTFLDVHTNDASAFFCPLKDKLFKANVNDTVYIRFKVLAYPEITSIIVTKSNRSQEENWRVEKKKLSKVLWFLDFTKDILHEEDFGNYTVKVTNNVDTHAVESFVISLKDSLRNIKISSTDNCTDETSTVFYRLIKSGLPLSESLNITMPIQAKIVQNSLASEYLIKFYVRNCTQFIGKQNMFQILAGSQNINISLSVSDKLYTIPTCAVTNQETTLFTSIGESVTFTMCLISENLIEEANVGFNNNTIQKYTTSKYSVKVERDQNQYNITWTINNITREDIKFYDFRVRDNLKRTTTFIANLNLKEGNPYMCNNTPIVKNVTNKTIYVMFCIRSYPVLSRAIIINGILYRINTTNDVIVESHVDKETFSNYIALTIPVIDSLKTVNITVMSVKNLTFSFIVNMDQTDEIARTLTTLTSITSKTSNTTTAFQEPLETPRVEYDEEKSSNTNIIIISVLVAAITISVIALLVYFIYFKRTLVKRRTSFKSRSRLKYLNQPHYNNMEELKCLKVDKDQNLSNYETRYANIVKERNVDQVVQNGTRNTEMAPGRFRNEEGLIYITIDHSDLQSRSSKSISKASQSETESNYVTIDPFKTKHFK